MTDNTFVQTGLQPISLADAHTHTHARKTHTRQRPTTSGRFRAPLRGRSKALLPPEKSTTNRHKDTHSLANARSFAGDTPAPPTRGTPPRPRLRPRSVGGKSCPPLPRALATALRDAATCSVGLCYPSWGIGCHCRGPRSPLAVAEWLWLFLSGGRVSQLGRPRGGPAFVYPPARGNSGAGLHGSAYGLRFTSAPAPTL